MRDAREVEAVELLSCQGGKKMRLGERGSLESVVSDWPMRQKTQQEKEICVSSA